MASSAASPSNNDGSPLKDDDSFTVVNSLGSSYFERYKDMMNDDGSLSSTSSLDSSSSSEAAEDDSSSSISSDSDGSSSSEEDDDYTQQQQQHCADLQLLTTVMKSKATRPTEIAWHQIRSSGSSNKNPQERLDDLCREYVDDEEENVWDLPLWELAAVLLDRLKDRADDDDDDDDDDSSGGRGEKEEESSSCSSSSSSCSSSSLNSSLSRSDSSTSLSSDEEDDVHHHDDDEDSLSQVSFHGTHHVYDSFTEDPPISSPSSPSDNAEEHGEMPDDGKRKITSASAVVDLNDTSAAASIEERDKEVFSPSNKKRRLSQGEMQSTSSAAAVGVAEAASAAKEAKIASSPMNNAMTWSPVSNEKKRVTPSSFAQKAKRKLFEKEQPPPTPTKPKKSGKYIVTYDWISYFAAKAFLAARKELKTAEEAEPPNNVKASSKTAAKVTEKNRTSNAKRPRGATQQRKQCSLEGCHKQAQKGGLFCASHGAQMFCSEVIGGTTQMNELCTSSEEEVGTRRDE